MRLRDHRRVLRTRHARTSILLGASLGLASLAAVPVASGFVDDEATDEPQEATPVDTTTAQATYLEGVAGNPGLDRWYTPEEAAQLSPDVETVQITIADAEASEPTAEPVSDEAEEHDEGDEGDDAPAERNRWDRLAECESGEWVNGGESFIEGSARWDYGIDFVHEGYEQFQGGLNFHPGTWDAFRDPDMPDHAGNATREQEIVVAERVLAEQGWQAWPRCSKMVGLR
jgi:hypothetical protein